MRRISFAAFADPEENDDSESGVESFVVNFLGKAPVPGTRHRDMCMCMCIMCVFVLCVCVCMCVVCCVLRVLLGGRGREHAVMCFADYRLLHVWFSLLLFAAAAAAAAAACRHVGACTARCLPAGAQEAHQGPPHKAHARRQQHGCPGRPRQTEKGPLFRACVSVPLCVCECGVCLCWCLCLCGYGVCLCLCGCGVCLCVCVCVSVSECDITLTPAPPHTHTPLPFCRGQRAPRNGIC